MLSNLLCHLSIRNFTLVDRLELDVSPGLSAITGETGAGKSILLDALSLTLGDRADFDKIRAGAERAEVTTEFDISRNSQARSWLETAALDEGERCILRRAITTGGRSQGWINGQACTMGQLQELGELLISIHGQHEHQNLLRRDEQRRLLDEFADHAKLLGDYQEAFRQWRDAHDQLARLEQQESAQVERLTFLQDALQELDRVAVGSGEFEELELEQARLAHAEALLSGLFKAQQLLSENDEVNSCQLVRQVLGHIDQLPLQTAAIEEARTLLDAAFINLEEASTTLRRALDQTELDPARLEEVELRLSTLFQLARKHRVQAAQLAAYHRELRDEIAVLADPQGRIDALRAQVDQFHKSCLTLAQKLSSGRQRAAKAMAKAINAYFPTLAMPGADLIIQVQEEAEHLGAWGIDQVEFLICTNPGKSHGPLGKIASGGELSRISLAIQMISAGSDNTPVLVFDEVDSGIGGATAERVGDLLRQLGERAQVICVTHLPQVASRAQHQLRVEKEVEGGETRTHIALLKFDARVEEIARMLGGQLTPQSLEHARVMLATHN